MSISFPPSVPMLAVALFAIAPAVRERTIPHVHGGHAGRAVSNGRGIEHQIL
jgi:hypothetical protein